MDDEEKNSLGLRAMYTILMYINLDPALSVVQPLRAATEIRSTSLP